jgi:DNA-binding transcriptional ArsR family regulator
MTLRILTERTASPKEIAEILDEPIRSVSHQVTKLRDDGLIELLEERKRGGTTEHFYRAIPILISDEEAETIDFASQQLQSTVVVQLMVGDLTHAMKSRSLDRRPDRHLSRVPMELDDQAWLELKAIFRRALDEAVSVRAATAERLAESGEKGAPVVAMLGLFDSPL